MISPEPDAAQYRQLAALLADQILGGVFAAGARLPSERDLMAEHGLSRDTVRKALHILQLRNLIVVRHGYPTRVAERPPVEPVKVPRGSTIEFTSASAEESIELGVGEGTVLVVLVEPSGRKRRFVWSRVRFTIS